MNNNLGEVTQKFYSIEKKLDLSNFSINNVPVWEYIRHQTHRDILKQKNVIGKAHKQIEYDMRTYFESLLLLLKNIFNKNPYFSGKRDVIFYGHQRRKQMENGNWWDIYCDPIHNETTFDSLHLETHHNFNHHQPAETDGLCYTDLIEFSAAAIRSLKITSSDIGSKGEQKLKNIEKLFKRKLDVCIDVTSRVNSKLRYVRSVKPIYKSLLKKIDPKIVVIVVGYGKQAFIESCKELNIPVIELQHGVITNVHTGYSFPHSQSNRTFPDYIFTWGEFWNEQANFPLPDESVLPVGYPFLERQYKKYKNTINNGDIIFISQGTIGKKLSKFALKVQEKHESDCEIIYKLHPGEYDGWKDRYPWLANSNIKVIADESTSLYNLFARCETQIGVYSTALYEGLCFGLNTYLYDLPGVEQLKPLLDQNFATLIRSAEDFDNHTSRKRGTFNRRYFFRNRPIKRITNTLEEIMNKHSN